MSSLRIKMAPGQVCWTYRGAATTFVGDFLHGQRIAAQMMGQASEYDPRTGAVASFWRARDPNVEGPGGFFFGDAEAPGALHLRRAGERDLPLQLFALRDVGRARRSENLRR